MKYLITTLLFLLSFQAGGQDFSRSVGIRGGAILRISPLEPVVFGEYWEGVFSSRQWVNGRMRRGTELPPPLDLFSPLGWGPSTFETEVSPTASVRLSVRAEASEIDR